MNMTIDYEKQMPFEFATVKLRLRAQQTIVFDKYPGAIFRSGLGAALHKLCRMMSARQQCSTCRLADRCPYAVIFESPHNGKQVKDFTAEYLPHPFVFQPPQLGHNYILADKSMDMSLTLFGHGIRHLIYFLYAFETLGEMGLGPARGRFSIDKVTDTVTKENLYDTKAKNIIRMPTTQTISDFCHKTETNKVTLKFITPTKLLNKDRSIATLYPDIFIKRLLRRGSMLAQLYMQPWDLDYKSLISEFVQSTTMETSNTRKQTIRTHSQRQQQTQNHQTMSGSVTFKGDIDPYMPLYKLGSVMHIGSGTSRGFGKYVASAH
jgi:hypothetical protein